MNEIDSSPFIDKNSSEIITPASVQVEFAVDLSDFDNMSEASKNDFKQNLAAKMQADLEASNPFPGGETVVEVDFRPKEKNRRRRQAPVEYEAVITVLGRNKKKSFLLVRCTVNYHY